MKDKNYFPLSNLIGADLLAGYQHHQSPFAVAGRASLSNYNTEQIETDSLLENQTKIMEGIVSKLSLLLDSRDYSSESVAPTGTIYIGTE